MTEHFEVAKWGHTVEVATSPCGTCGQPVLHNLGWKVVTHPPDAVDPCDAPWPDEPRPAYVTAVIEQQQADTEALRRGAGLLDVTASAPALGLEPHHRRGKQRTDGERATLTARALACATQDDVRRAAGRVRADMLAPKMATGGVVIGAPFDGPGYDNRGVSDGACCQAAYDSDGFAHDHEVVR
jgi:hypothetical protein